MRVPTTQSPVRSESGLLAPGERGPEERATILIQVSPLGKMVPGVGVEPTRLSSVDFESTASADSATRAWIAKHLTQRDQRTV